MFAYLLLFSFFGFIVCCDSGYVVVTCCVGVRVCIVMFCGWLSDCLLFVCWLVCCDVFALIVFCVGFLCILRVYFAFSGWLSGYGAVIGVYWLLVFWLCFPGVRLWMVMVVLLVVRGSA